MLADTEALDSYFANKYSDGSTEKFLQICKASVQSTDDYLETFRSEYANAQFFATSFLDLFQDELSEREVFYSENLARLYESKELPRVDKDVERRGLLYERMYGGDVEHEFLAMRTIRTMGQYLALGELVGRDPQGCIIVHDTVNASLFQDCNKYVGVTSSASNLHTPPVIKQDLRVY